jgi:Ca2+-binding RTX toxin-like protein
MAKSDFYIGSNIIQDQSLSPRQQERLEDLKQKFSDKFGEDYLQEHATQVSTFSELRDFWKESKLEARQEAKAERQQEKLEALQDKISEKVGSDYLDNLGIEFDSFQSLKTHWQEVRQELKEQKKSDNDTQEETPEEPVQFDAQTNTYSISVGVSAEEINAIIENAEADATISLQDGTHEFTQTLEINRDDVTLSGESESGTILNFTFQQGTGGNAIEVIGGEKTLITSIEATEAAGSKQLTLADASSISVGDVIYISQANTMEYLLDNDWANVSFEDADDRPFREMIVRVESVEGNTIKLASPLPYDFDANVTNVFTTDLLENVSLSDFTITSGLDAEPNYYDYVNTFAEFNNMSVILVNGADGLDLNSISILDAPSSGFDFRSTIDLTADNLYVNGAHNLGSSGNGYGINLYETFDATIIDVEIFNVRHAVLFSSWNAEAGNYIEITETNRDINFHGSPDVNNEVVVLKSVLDYDPSQNTGSGIGFWDIVSGGGSRHANSDIYAENKVVFSHAVGSTGTEIIYGADGGAYLDGQGSQDMIFGGVGDDIIIGGTSQDVLTGGEGADLFVFRAGDSYDAITDFSGNLQGDRILIMNPDIQSYDELVITQKDEDVWVKYGNSSTIILSGFEADLLQPEFFLFNSGDLL